MRVAPARDTSCPPGSDDFESVREGEGRCRERLRECGLRIALARLKPTSQPPALLGGRHG